MKKYLTTILFFCYFNNFSMDRKQELMERFRNCTLVSYTIKKNDAYTRFKPFKLQNNYAIDSNGNEILEWTEIPVFCTSKKKFIPLASDNAFFSLRLKNTLNDYQEHHTFLNNTDITNDNNFNRLLNNYLAVAVDHE